MNPALTALRCEREGRYKEAWEASVRVKSHTDATAQVMGRVARHHGCKHHAIRVLERVGSLASSWELIHLYDEVGEYRKAYELAVKSNEEKKTHWRPYIENKREPLDSVRTERPVFIVGMPRSGTTLLYQMLKNHPDLTGVGECDWFPKFAQGLKGYPKDYGNLDAMAEIYGGNNTLDKHPMNWVLISLIKSVFPGARMIHLDRDWRDVAVSCYFRDFLKGYEWAYDMKWIEDVCAQKYEMVEHFDLPTIHYEDLVSDPEATMDEVLRMVDLAPCDAVYTHDRNIQPDWSYEEVRKPLNDKSVGRWQNYPWLFDPGSYQGNVLQQV